MANARYSENKPGEKEKCKPGEDHLLKGKKESGKASFEHVPGDPNAKVKKIHKQGGAE